MNYDEELLELLGYSFGECVYQNFKYKIIIGYDGFQLWQKCCIFYDIFVYVRTFSDLSLAFKYIDDNNTRYLKNRKI